MVHSAEQLFLPPGQPQGQNGNYDGLDGEQREWGLEGKREVKEEKKEERWGKRETVAYYLTTIVVLDKFLQ